MLQVTRNDPPQVVDNRGGEGQGQASAVATSAMATSVVAAEAQDCDIATRHVPTICRAALLEHGLYVIPALQVPSKQMAVITSLCQPEAVSTIGGENTNIWPNIAIGQGDIGLHSPCIFKHNIASIPQEVIDEINDLAVQILSWVQIPSLEESVASNLQLNVYLRSGTQNVFANTEGEGWHVDYVSTDPVLSCPHVRFICTLHGPTTRFLPFSEEEKQLKTLWASYRGQDKLKIFQTYLPESMVQVGFHARSPVFSPKPGEVVAFIAGTQNGTIHSGPTVRDPRRIVVLFDLYDRAIHPISRSFPPAETVGKEERQ